MILNFGVIDIPYRLAPSRRGRAKSSTVTTGDVAGWLEDKYQVMENFWRAHGNDIAIDLEKSVQAGLENWLLGAPTQNLPFAGGLSKAEDRFKQFLSTAEIERMGVPGVPTQAALRGVSHRFKRPYVRRARRPSFVDTGQFQAAFKAWIE